MGGIVAQGAFADLFQRLLAEDVLCLAGVLGGGLLVQRTAAKILRDRVKPLCIDFLDGMICGKLPLLPSTKIPDLTAGAPAFVSGSQTVTVLGISCVGSQEPFPADGAFSRRVSDA